ncbi:MAG: TatD family hydrolase [Treponemataceae bacterium]|nr:TatD family hydrolase [Treponemataceae bacterium]
MFSDTHFHFQHFVEGSHIDGADVLSRMAERGCLFGMDIGTHADDLAGRQACAARAIASIAEPRLASRARRLLHFSAGIWPSPEEIANRERRMDVLRAQVADADGAPSSSTDSLNRSVIAIGECGLDHHWNPAGADGRSVDDFDVALLSGERELFEMQLEFAREQNLPVVVHSRDAFADTLACIKNVGYDNGIIHCYSYGADEAAAFLERGWHISFSGSVTYTKKAKMEELKRLLRIVPDDRILCETDAPYLAPVPLRGRVNTPLLVEHTYRFIAEIRGTTPEELSRTVDRNIARLFHLAV